MAEKAVSQDADGYGRPVAWTVGFILLAISMIASGILYITAYMHDGNILWEEGYIAVATTYLYVITGTMLILVAAYGFAKQVYAESLFFAINAAFMLVVGVCGIKGFELGNEAMMMIDLMLGLLLLVPTIIFIVKRHVLLSIAALLYIVANIGNELFSSPSDAVVYGSLALIAGLMFAYVALVYLVKKETKIPLPYI